MEKNKKRIFLGFDVEALWGDVPKDTKLIGENHRHITLLFLGINNVSEINFDDLPKCSFEIGPVGYFDKCLFLPVKHPRLAAYRADFFEKNKEISEYRHELFGFFKKKGFPVKDKNDFLPHATICRNDFDMNVWKKSFRFLPLYVKSMNLYESLKNSRYATLWKRDFIKPFVEIEHTADIAFIIKGRTYADLLYNSFIALSFKTIDFLIYNKELCKADSIDDVIIKLNEIITKAEIDGINIPFKAVSFHADIEEKDNILNWEMIVDV